MHGTREVYRNIHFLNKNKISIFNLLFSNLSLIVHFGQKLIVDSISIPFYMLKSMPIKNIIVRFYNISLLHYFLN